MNHRSAPVELRERAAVSESALHDCLRRILEDENIEEAVLLATCNRAEIYASVRDSAPCNAAETAIAHLAACAGAKPQDFAGHTYFYEEDRAVQHLMRVSAGLDSMMLGEYQILGQVRTAYDASQRAGAAGRSLNSLFQNALALGKKVRTTTSIGRGAFSIGAAAVELASQIFGDSLAGKTVLVLGAGEMGELTARHVHAHGAPAMLVTNRTYEHAVELARKIGSNASARRYDDLPDALLTSDIVICSTSAPHAVITLPMIQSSMRARRNRPLFIVDIAVPRDVEPSVGALENVYLYNIDDLSQVVTRDQNKRQIEAQKVEEMIDDAVDTFRSSRLASEAGALISSVSTRFNTMMQNELEGVKQHRPNISERELKLIEDSLRSITGQLSHDIIMTIRNCAQDGSLESQSRLEAIRAVFAAHPEPLVSHDIASDLIESYEARLTHLRSKVLSRRES